MITPRRGEVVTHHGGLQHSSVPTTGGTRYILVAFARSPPLVVEPPFYVEGSYCVNSQAAAASWAAGAGAGGARGAPAGAAV